MLCPSHDPFVKAQGSSLSACIDSLDNNPLSKHIGLPKHAVRSRGDVSNTSFPPKHTFDTVKRDVRPQNSSLSGEQDLGNAPKNA